MQKYYFDNLNQNQIHPNHIFFCFFHNILLNFLFDIKFKSFSNSLIYLFYSLFLLIVDEPLISLLVFHILYIIDFLNVF